MMVPPASALDVRPPAFLFGSPATDAAPPPDSLTDAACALCERVLAYLDEERRLVENNMVRDAVDKGYLDYVERSFAAFRSEVEGEVRALRARVAR